MIQLERLVYRYPTAIEPALRGIDWSLDAGEFVLVAGESGSGKTSLLRSLTGIIPHFYGGWFGGQVRVVGLDTRLARPVQLAASVGYVGQEPEAQTLLDRVRDEVGFALENRGLPPATVAARVEEALDLVGISHLRDRPIETLSGGERQRVLLAAVLALRPRILVLDEPTSQLDPWAAESVLELLRRLVDDLGLTVIVAEHRLDRLLGRCDRLTVLQDGTIVADGPPATAVDALPSPPTLVQLSRLLGWQPPALTVARARAYARTLPLPAPTRVAIVPGESVLAFERVRVCYGGRPVLDDVSLEFHAGEVTAIVGRNGAGKTTLLRVGLGAQSAQNGRVWLLGYPAEQVPRPVLAAQVSFVSQYPAALFLTSRLQDDLELARRARQVTVEEAFRLAERFTLSHRLSTHPVDLSSGERQRAALLLALLGHPRLLLLDEPTRGLDSAHKQLLAAELRSRASVGSCVIVTTHDVDFAGTLADRIVLLSDGRVVADGTPETVLGESLAYAPTVSRVFGPAFRHLEDVRAALELLSIAGRTSPGSISYTGDVERTDRTGQ